MRNKRYRAPNFLLSTHVQRHMLSSLSGRALSLDTQRCLRPSHAYRAQAMAASSAPVPPLTATSWRNTALAARHRALGSQLEDWNGMPTGWVYSDDPTIEKAHVAIRTAVGLMDVSGLKKCHLVGPHATAVIDYLTTRNAHAIAPGRSQYACLLSEQGKFVEDAVLFRMGPNSWMVVHGGGSGHELLAAHATGRNCALLFDDDMHDLSLQGPKAIDLLARHVPGIRDLPYFAHTQATLFGKPVMISRTGYTGERGYELFMKACDATPIWDGLLESGSDLGIMPCGFTALDLLRVESSLLFYPFDMSETYPDDFPGPLGATGDSLWELGLTFTVTKGKKAWRGCDAHYRLKGQERFKIFGVLMDSDATIPPNGAPIFDASGANRVGTITQAMRSSLTKRGMAIARLAVDCAQPGVALKVSMGEGGAMVGAATHALPFDDPKKEKRLAKG